VIGNLIVACLSLAVGWGALFPLRRSLGPGLYHLSALPVGTIGWSVVAALTTVAEVRPSPMWVAFGLTVYVVMAAAVARLFAGTVGSAPVSWRSFALVGAGFVSLSGLLAWAGLTLVGADSYSHYELSGWFLADTGRLSPIIMGSRNTLLPAMHMANRIFGADWLYVPYPLFSANTLAITAWVLWRHAFVSLPGRTRLAATAVVAGTLAIVPPWFYHTWLVHSNMASAMFTTLALTAVLAAAGVVDRRAQSASEKEVVGSRSAALGVVAGFALAGLALARPDGLAYVFQGLIVAAVCHLSGALSRRAIVAAYAALSAPLLVVYGAAFLRIGVWSGDKLQGSWAVALLGAILVFGVLTVLAGTIEPILEWLRRVGGMRLAIAVNVLAIVAVAATDRGQFLFALRNMVANLALMGTWGLTWWVVLLGVVLSLVVRVRDVEEPGRQLLLFAVFQFFAIALVLHASVHPGHISPSDSFNRVALHIVPTAFWYLASYAGSPGWSKGSFVQLSAEAAP